MAAPQRLDEDHKLGGATVHTEDVTEDQKQRDHLVLAGRNLGTARLGERRNPKSSPAVF